MRHKKRNAKLGRSSSHREAMISNMITSLFRHERIKTTLQKAKESRRFAEKAITLAKKNTLHSRRLASRQIKDDEVLSKLFSVIGPRFADRNGGYTRIINIGHREGDGAGMVFLELVDRIYTEPEKEGKKKKKAAKGKAAEETPAEAETITEGEIAEKPPEEAESEIKAEGDEKATEEVPAESEEPVEEAPAEAEGAPAEETEEKKKEDSGKQQ